MRTIAATCASVLVSLLAGVTLFAGCTAEGSSPLVTGIGEPTEPPAEAKLPPPSSPPAPTGDGGGAGGTTKPDGGKDAGPAGPSPGDPCATVNQTFKRTCGACGTQTALCLADEDGGALRVSDYSVCTNEVSGGCIAGTTENVACGNCGTQKKTCDATCKWFTAACVQPAGACKAGTADYTIAGCPAKNTYRHRSCDVACTWSAYTACEEPANDVVVEVNGTVGQLSAGQISLSAAQMAAAVPNSGSCPAASLVAGDYPYAYFEVRNTTSKQAKVAVTTSVPAGGTSIYMSLVGYKLPFVPSSDAARLDCAYGPSTSLSNIVIEPGTSILVYARTYYAYNPSNPNQTTGVMNVNVRSDALL